MFFLSYLFTLLFSARCFFAGGLSCHERVMLAQNDFWRDLGGFLLLFFKNVLYPIHIIMLMDLLFIT